MNKTHVIQRKLSPRVGAPPQLRYMRVCEDGTVGWVEDPSAATKFTRDSAGAFAWSANQEYERTNIGPSYVAVEA